MLGLELTVAVSDLFPWEKLRCWIDPSFDPLNKSSNNNDPRKFAATQDLTRTRVGHCWCF